MRVGRRYKFDASHYVEGLPAPWSEAHPHRYTVEIVAEGRPYGGRAIDHEALDGWFEANTPSGRLLNDDPQWGSTTVEDIAARILGSLPNMFGGVIVEVTVWEDDERWATARA